MKRRRTGFTLVELLTVLAIVSMLIGLILPSMAMVRRIAKETKQKAQLNSIGLALTAFRDDYGDYPRSTAYSDSIPTPDYSGGQKLAEALLGWDLLGFHPDSIWDSVGSVYGAGTLDERKGHYLELGTENAFRLALLFAELGPAPLAADTHVICDVFGVKDILLANGQKVRAGTPILYYKANTASKIMDPTDDITWAASIYNYADNMRLINEVDEDPVMGAGHRLHDNPTFFYEEYIRDPKVIAAPWPYRPDSYLLISAGADGLYGTTDDITNFGN
jgi:prepilin-type N-terminal cleavage/methylation domain-containing protein